MIESVLTIETYLTDVANEISSQADVGKLFPGTVMSLADTVDQVRDFVDSSECGLAYECIIGLLEILPFELSAASSLKLLDVALSFGYKTTRKGVFDAIFDGLLHPKGDGENNRDPGLKHALIERNVSFVWYEIGKHLLNGDVKCGYNFEYFCSDDVFLLDCLRNNAFEYGCLLIINIIKKHLLKISGVSVVRLIEIALLLDLGCDQPRSELQVAINLRMKKFATPSFFEN